MSVATDNKGNWTTIGTLGGGATTPAVGGGIQVAVTNAPSVYYLTGIGVEAGGSISNLVIGVTGEFVLVGDEYKGVAFTVGSPNVLIPVEVHGYLTYTWDLGELTPINLSTSDIYNQLEWLNDNLPYDTKFK